ncbi:50S ribosomal protein L6 [Candidatus Vampirococcus lugosii]|uniref:Large ribosomal subunit protein uL6 n=1 Tax=Candidatus Vampirococcus lugosii TaxID=2789015 RepID=A0ABS5QL06_9BACT|nr:50S ribosomal protein L6 [Candidatus Vampirococcus lugosii]MBS8121890.1 50S ribosomal protein L6 [Candidatus Vampirococcus lugosii]
MSRIGKLPILILEGVDIDIKGTNISVKGPKGQLNYTFPNEVSVVKNDGNIEVSISEDSNANLWGLVRSLINNMVEGVKNGFEKKLLVIGVGYSVKVEGKKVVLNLGYSHPINYEIPEGIDVKVDKDSKGNFILTISGIDKQLVGQVAANIRFLRLPEPYKGKGVRYFDEKITLKVGKTAKK